MNDRPECYTPAVRKAIILSVLVVSTTIAQDRVTFEDLPAIVLSNDKFALTVVPEGGAMAAMTLADDKDKTNPLWNPYWIAREAKLNRPTNFYRGHFVCVDGFGPSPSCTPTLKLCAPDTYDIDAV